MPRTAFAVALALLAAGCGPPELAARAAFQGDVLIASGGSELRARLTWARPSGRGDGTLQFDATADGRSHNVTLLPDGRIVAFTDASPREPTGEERRLAAALAAIAGWPGPPPEGPAATRVDRTTARLADGGEVRLTILVDRPPGPHGR